MSPSSSILTPSRRPLSSQIGLAHTLIAPHLILRMLLSLSSSSSFPSLSSSPSEQPGWSQVGMFGDDKEVAQRHAQLGKVGAVHSNTGSTVLLAPTPPLFPVVA